MVKKVDHLPKELMLSDGLESLDLVRLGVVKLFEDAGILKLVRSAGLILGGTVLVIKKKLFGSPSYCFEVSEGNILACLPKKTEDLLDAYRYLKKVFREDKFVDRNIARISCLSVFYLLFINSRRLLNVDKNCVKIFVVDGSVEEIAQDEALLKEIYNHIILS